MCKIALCKREVQTDVNHLVVEYLCCSGVLTQYGCLLSSSFPFLADGSRGRVLENLSKVDKQSSIMVNDAQKEILFVLS